jgi:hypothetical protein
MQRGIGRTVHALVSSALPSLRVVALVYTGLSGIAVLLVVATAALVPSAPILQQVTEPARQAVTSFVQPTTEHVTPLITPAPAVTRTAPEFVATTSLEVQIAPEPVVLEVTIVPVPRPTPAFTYVAPTIDLTQPDVPSDAEVVDDSTELAPAPDVVEAAPEQATLQIASVEQPRALPTPVIPTTPAEVKAQVDAANQAAIDAKKAAAAQAKAQADAANQAAIDAAKAAKAAAKH